MVPGKDCRLDSDEEKIFICDANYLMADTDTPR